jgi:hypothetical protein
MTEVQFFIVWTMVTFLVGWFGGALTWHLLSRS